MAEGYIGPHPSGISIVTPDLRFVIVDTGDGRKPAKTTEEYAALRRSDLAFSGIATFSADPDRPNGLKMAGKVDLAWNEEWTSTTQTRFLSVEGDRLTIRTPPSKNPILVKWVSRPWFGSGRSRNAASTERGIQFEALGHNTP